MDLLKTKAKEVDRLRARFGPHGCVTEAQFCTALRAAKGGTRHSPEELGSLFQAIDVCRSGTVTWEQFTMYAIDLEMAARTEVSADCIREYALESVFYDEIPQSVRSLEYFPRLDALAKLVYRGRQSVVKLCTPIPTAPYSATGPLGAPPVCVEIVPNPTSYDTLAVACSDMSLQFWEVRPASAALATMARQHHCRCDETQLCASYVARYGRLFTGSRGGRLSIWSPPGEAQPEVRQSDRLHEQAITDVASVDNDTLTASLDSSIKITDVSRGRVKAELQGHRQGVRKLAYCKEYHLLLSAGFEYDPFLWMFHMTDLRPWKLEDPHRPHQDVLVGLDAIEGTPQLVSFDRKGMMKIWDVRTFRCVQTLVAEVPSQQLCPSSHAASRTTSLCCMPRHGRIAVCGRTVSVFRGSATEKPAHADDAGGCTLLYSTTARTFLTAHRRTLKVWGADGRLTHQLGDVTTSEITAACQDAEGRRFFVGTADGTVLGYSWATLRQYTRFDGHAGHAVVCLAFLPPPAHQGGAGLQGRLVTASAGGVWCLPDEGEARPRELRSLTKAAAERGGGGGVVSCGAALSGSGLVAVGTTAGVVVAADAESGNLVGSASLAPPPPPPPPAPHRDELEGDASPPPPPPPLSEVRCLTALSGSLVAFTDASSTVYVASLRAGANQPTQTALQPASHPQSCAWRLLGAQSVFVAGRGGGGSGGGCAGPQRVGEAGACLVSRPHASLYNLDPSGASEATACGGGGGGDAAAATVACCLGFDAEEGVLYAGDQRGWLVGYDVARVLREVEGGRRLGGGGASWRQVSALRLWRAHSDEVVSMVVVSERARLATASFDGQVLLWCTSGRCLAALQQGRVAQEGVRRPTAVHDAALPDVPAAAAAERPLSLTAVRGEEPACPEEEPCVSPPAAVLAVQPAEAAPLSLPRLPSEGAEAVPEPPTAEDEGGGSGGVGRGVFVPRSPALLLLAGRGRRPMPRVKLRRSGEARGTLLSAGDRGGAVGSAWTGGSRAGPLRPATGVGAGEKRDAGVRRRLHSASALPKAEMRHLPSPPTAHVS